MIGREKRSLGDLFHLKDIGVNLTQLKPGAQSALFHKHSRQEEFIYILEGYPTLITDNEDVLLTPGMCAGFSAHGVSHCLINNTGNPVLFLEISSRVKGDSISYPLDGFEAVETGGGVWKFSYVGASSHHHDVDDSNHPSMNIGEEFYKDTL
jgi:uncharacterized cupin superfamily protein